MMLPGKIDEKLFIQHPVTSIQYLFNQRLIPWTEIHKVREDLAVLQYYSTR
ncbi:MAG: hypothetical protein JRJ69_13365 [Deltaproteobacteria bacterium]|nr:hypothetical protein [Deltaproteobacteria bacterium]